MRKKLIISHSIFGIAQVAIVILPVILEWFINIPSWLTIIWLGVIVFSAIFELIVQKYMGEVEQKFEKQLSPLLTYIAKKLGIHTSDLASAFHIATGEVSRWYFIQMFFTITSLTIVLALLMPKYLFFFIPLLFFSSLWINNAVKRKKGMTDIQNEFLQAYQELKRKQENYNFTNKDFDLEKEWRKVENLRKSFLKQNLIFTGGLILIIKIGLPLAGVLMGVPLAGYLISTYLHFLFGTNYFVRSISEAFFHIKKLGKMIQKGELLQNFVTFDKWEKLNQGKTIPLQADSIQEIDINNIVLKNIFDKSKIQLKTGSLKLNRNETVLITGKSGSGKTMLSKIITSQVLPDKGEIILTSQEQDDKRISFNINHSLKDLKRAIRYHNLEDIENNYSLEAILKDNQIDSKDYLLNVKSIFPEIIQEDIKRPFSTFSNGQRRRLKLAMILMQKPNPSFLILDEPFSGLDGESLALVKDYLKNWTKNNDAGLIIIEHRTFDKNDFITKEWKINEKGEIGIATDSENNQMNAIKASPDYLKNNLVKAIDCYLNNEEFLNLSSQEQKYFITFLLRNILNDLSFKERNHILTDLKNSSNLSKYISLKTLSSLDKKSNITLFRKECANNLLQEKTQKLRIIKAKEIEKEIREIDFHLQKTIFNNEKHITEVKRGSFIDKYMIKKILSKNYPGIKIQKSFLYEKWSVFNMKNDILKKFQIKPTASTLKLLKQYDSYDSFNLLSFYLDKNIEQLDDLKIKFEENLNFAKIIEREYLEDKVRLSAALLKKGCSNVVINNFFNYLEIQLVNKDKIEVESEEKVNNYEKEKDNQKKHWELNFNIIKYLKPLFLTVFIFFFITIFPIHDSASITNLVKPVETFETVIQLPVKKLPTLIIPTLNETKALNLTYSKSHICNRTLYAPISGTVKYLHPSGEVKKGALLYEINDTSLERDISDLKLKLIHFKKDYLIKKKLEVIGAVSVIEKLKAKMKLERAQSMLLFCKLKKSRLKKIADHNMMIASDSTNFHQGAISQGDELFKIQDEQNRISINLSHLLFNYLTSQSTLSVKIEGKKYVFKIDYESIIFTENGNLKVDLVCDSKAVIDLKKFGDLQININKKLNHKTSGAMNIAYTKGFKNIHSWETPFGGVIKKRNGHYYLNNIDAINQCKSLSHNLNFLKDKLSRNEILLKSNGISKSKVDQLKLEIKLKEHRIKELRQEFEVKIPHLLNDSNIVINSSVKVGAYIPEHCVLFKYVKKNEFLLETQIPRSVNIKEGDVVELEMQGKIKKGKVIKLENGSNPEKTKLIIETESSVNLPENLMINIKVNALNKLQVNSSVEIQTINSNDLLLSEDIKHLVASNIDNTEESHPINGKGIKIKKGIDSKNIKEPLLEDSKSKISISWLFPFFFIGILPFSNLFSFLKKSGLKNKNDIHKRKEPDLSKTVLFDILNWISKRLDNNNTRYLHSSFHSEYFIFEQLKKIIRDSFVNDHDLSMIIRDIQTKWKNKGDLYSWDKLKNMTDYQLEQKIKKEKITIIKVLTKEEFLYVSSKISKLGLWVEVQTKTKSVIYNPLNNNYGMFKKAA